MNQINDRFGLLANASHYATIFGNIVLLLRAMKRFLKKRKELNENFLPIPDARFFDVTCLGTRKVIIQVWPLHFEKGDVSSSPADIITPLTHFLNIFAFFCNSSHN